MLDIGLESLITFNPAAVRPDTPLADAWRLMQSLGVRHLPTVTDAGELVGLLSIEDVRRWALCHSRVDLARADTYELADGPSRPPLPTGPIEPTCGIVANVMQKNPLTLDDRASPRTILRAMLRHQFHSLPIVSEGRLVGIVTTTDILREFGYAGDQLGREPVSQHMLDDEAQIEWDAPLETAAARMLELGVTHLAVVRGACPIGILSRRLLKLPCSTRNADGETLTAGQAAHGNAPALRPADTLAEAALRLVDAASPAALVVDRASRFVGLLTEDHILGVLAGGE